MSGKYTRLVSEFRKVFAGLEPTHMIRVPGRVNLIGEHLDYNGLPVLPMAIDRDIRLLLAPRGDGVVEVRNVSPDFAVRSFRIEEQIPRYETGDWGNYLKAGVQDVITLAQERNMDVSSLNGFSVLIDSDLPAAAGLSSSSALVIASALTALAANGLTISRQELADRMALAETYVGTMGGGMDHAAILLSNEGAALKIDFFPLGVSPASLPTGYSVVIANTMVAAPKTAAARRRFNRLPIECRMATQILRRVWEAKRGPLANVQRIADFLPVMPAEELLQFAEEQLCGVKWTKENTAAALGISINDLEAEFLQMRDGQVMPEPEEGFLLVDRMRHVISEGVRVNRSFQALQAGDIAVFGRLMNASHTSCRDNFHISCPELEQLVEIARSNGAIGSRLTGAGFGGCCVSVIPSEQVDCFRQAITEQYYKGFLQAENPDLYKDALERGLNNVILVSSPSSGAWIAPLQASPAILDGVKPDIVIA